MFAVGIQDESFFRLAQVLKMTPHAESSAVEIFWDEPQDSREPGHWSWHYLDVGEVFYPLEGAESTDPAAEDEDLEFLASLDPEFPTGPVQFSIDRDNTPIFGDSWQKII